MWSGENGEKKRRRRKKISVVFLLNSNKGEGGKKMKADATKKERVILCGFIGYRERIAASMRIKHACDASPPTQHTTQHTEREENHAP